MTDLTCDGCGRTDQEVHCVQDPWEMDVYGISRMLPLCPDCYQLRCDDI